MASRYRSRRGSFGLQPRVAPNISGQIIALAREYAARRDSNIMDAWRNGGTFEGKKVTDEMVLAYWEEKQKGLDPEDPNYNSNANQILQLQYGIEQSKQDLLHVQGKISDQQYAQFYIKWAKKVPRNSEFYRTLQKDAAQLIEQGRQKAKSAAEQAKTDRFNEFVKRTTDSKIAVGNYLTQALVDLAKQTGMSVTGNGDVLLSMLTTDVKNNPDKYHGLLDSLSKADPTFDGNITESYFNKSVSDATQGYSDIADKARAGGFVTAYASAVQSQSSMAQWGQNIKTWPIAQSYSTADDAMDRVWSNPNSSQMEKTAAAIKAAETYESLASTPGIDAGTREQLLADAARLRGEDGGDAPSYGSAQLGRNGVTPEQAMQISTWTKMQADMAANPAAFAYGPTDRNGNYDPTGAGPVGIVPRGSIPSGAVAVMIPTGTGGSVLSYVQPQPIYTTDPNTGKEVLAGQHIAYNVGGKPIELWGYIDGGGNAHWSSTSPLVDGAQTSYDGNGSLHVTQPSTAAADPIAVARWYAQQEQYQPYAAELIGLAAQMQQQRDQGSPLESSFGANTFDANKGTKAEGVVVSYKDGQIQIEITSNEVDPQTGSITQTSTTPYILPIGNPLVSAWSPSAIAAGDIPGATFDSPLAASVSAARYTQTQDQARAQAGNPEFQQQFIIQTMNTLHIDNPYDVRIAQAWKAATTGDNSATIRAQTQALVDAGVPPAVARNRLRGDLTYPGSAPVTEGNTGSVNVRFGATTINIPNLPSYMGSNKTLTPQEMGQAFATGGILNGVVTPPTYGPTPTMNPAGPTPTGSPAPTTAPTSTVSPTATPSPTQTPVPTLQPDPFATPIPTLQPAMGVQKPTQYDGWRNK